MIYQLTQTGDQVQTILDQAPTTEQSLQEEITRSTGKDEQLETAIGNEKTRAEGVEANLQTAIGNEKTRAEGAEGNLQTAIGNEKTRAELVEGGLRTDVDGINAKIPTGASSENKLATQSFVNSSVATATADFKGTYNSLEALETAVHDANANDYAFVISTDAAGNTVYNRYKYVDGTGWVFEYALNNSSFTSAQWAAINSAITAALVAKLTGLPTATELTTQLNAIIDSVATEKSRAEGIESGLRTDVNANATAIGTEKTRAEGAEGNLSTAIGNEKTRAEAAELLLQQNINAEALLRGNADTALQTSIDGINAKIPAAASASNQLADKTFVNSSIATNTATFRGTYNSVEALDEVTADNNDYAFVVATDTAGNTVYNRYKYVEGSGWVFEYALNNSSFTATQWAAVNSGITAALVTKLTGLPDNTALTAMFAAITSLVPAAATSDNKLVDYAQLVAGLATKQNTLTFDNAPTENSSNPVKSGGVYTAIATVTAAIVGLQSSKQDVLTFDQYPTAGSNNPVKSTGIYTAIENAVAPKANQTALDAETTRATNAESGLSTRISTNAADIAALQAAYAGLTQNDVVVVATTDTWPVSNPQQNVIYRVVDRVNTPPQYYSDYMWNGTSMVQMAEYDNAIDEVPTAGSNNLVKSGGVYKMLQSYTGNLERGVAVPFFAKNGQKVKIHIEGEAGVALRFNTEDYYLEPYVPIPTGATSLDTVVTLWGDVVSILAAYGNLTNCEVRVVANEYLSEFIDNTNTDLAKVKSSFGNVGYLEGNLTRGVAVPFYAKRGNVITLHIEGEQGVALRFNIDAEHYIPDYIFIQSGATTKDAKFRISDDIVSVNAAYGNLTNVKISRSVSEVDINEAFFAHIGTGVAGDILLTDDEFELGHISGENGQDISGAGTIRSIYKSAIGGSTISYDFGTYRFDFFEYDDHANYIKHSDWKTGSGTIKLDDRTSIFRISVSGELNGVGQPIYSIVNPTFMTSNLPKMVVANEEDVAKEIIYAPSPQLPAGSEDDADFNAETLTPAELYAAYDGLLSKQFAPSGNTKQSPKYGSKNSIEADDASGNFKLKTYVFTRRNRFAWKNADRLYGWTNNGVTLYTDSCSPRIGDVLYSDGNRTNSGKTVSAYNSAAQSLSSSDSVTYSRDNSKNIAPKMYWSKSVFPKTGNTSSSTLELFEKNGASVGNATYVDDTHVLLGGANYERCESQDYHTDNKMTLFLWANEHGPQSDPSEPAIILYRLAKDLCGGCRNNAFLQFLKNYCKVIILPVANPYGMNSFVVSGSYGRNNYNNVNINRNYDTVGWASQADADKGSYAGDQPETQYIMNMCLDFEADVAIDIHCLGYVTSDNEGRCHYEGSIPTSSSSYNEMIADMMVGFGMEYSSYGGAAPSSHAMGGDWIYSKGIIGGLIEMNAGKYAASYNGGQHTAEVMEIDYTLLLNTIRMWMNGFGVEVNL